MSMLLLTVLLSANAGPHVIEDDFAAAKLKAKREKKLLFVDAWAPWCHTCVFMREHVLTRPSFKAFESQLVFASVDTEKTKNAPFITAYPVNVWPTLFIIDPSNDAVRFTWGGSADESQLTAFLEAAKATREGPGTPLAKADAAAARGEMGTAADAYLAAKPPTTDARAMGSMLYALYIAGRFDVCTSSAAEATPDVVRPQDRVAVLGWGLTCALMLPAQDPTRAKHLPTLAALAAEAVRLPDVLIDDLSGVYEALVAERTAAKDADKAKAWAAEWLDMLERSAAAAPTPAARAAYDAHRLSAALALGQPARVVDALRLSEQQLPTDFNPSARLAVALRDLGRYDEALAAADRALTKNREGPRRVCLFRTKATVLQKKGDVAGQIKAANDGLAYAKSLKPSKVLTGCLSGLEVTPTP